MNSLKKNLIILGAAFLLLAVITTVGYAQLYYPPVNPFYGYNYGFSPTFAPPVPFASTSFAPAYGTLYEAPYVYRGAHALITQLALLGLLPTTATSTSTLLPSYTVPSTLPTTTTTIGYTTSLLLGGSSSSSTTALLLASTATPTTTSTIGTTTALLLGGTSTTTLLALGI